MKMKIPSKLKGINKKKGSEKVALQPKVSGRNTQNITVFARDFALKTKGLILKPSYLWAILVFAFLTRLYNIGNLGINENELKNVDRIFAMSNIGNFLNQNVSTNLYYLLQNIWGRFFGFSITNMRIFSVLLSVLGLYLFFKFTEEWFNRRLAYIATFLLSISSYHILLSRNISHEVLYFALVIFAFHTLTLAYRRKSRFYFALSGFLFGLAFYASEITFALALLFAIALIYFYKKNSRFFTSFVKEKIIAVSAGFLTILPFLYAAGKNPNIFLSHFTLGINMVLNNINLFFSSLILSAPRGYEYTVSTDKVFDPFVLLTFLLGSVYACIKIKRRKFYFLVSWFFLLTLIMICEKEFSLGGFIYILPVIFILSARIQTYVLDKWFKTFPFNRFARITAIAGIGFMFALSLTYNYRKVFAAWQKYPERNFVYNSAISQTDFGKNTVFLYKTGLDRPALESILKNGGENNLKDISDVSSLKGKFNLLTSPQAVSNVRLKLKDKKFQITSGHDIVLMKGE